MKGLQKFTVQIYLDLDQVEFVKSLVQPATWEEHQGRILAGLCVAQIARLKCFRQYVSEGGIQRDLSEVEDPLIPGPETAASNNTPSDDKGKVQGLDKK